MRTTTKTKRKKQKRVKIPTNYPWDQWLVPGTLRVVQGVDFDCTINQFVLRLRAYGPKRGLSVRVTELPDGHTVVADIMTKEDRRAHRKPERVPTPRKPSVQAVLFDGVRGSRPRRERGVRRPAP